MGGGGGPGNIFKVLKAKPTIIKGDQKDKVPPCPAPACFCCYVAQVGLVGEVASGG
jgi:hypothetical protein